MTATLRALLAEIIDYAGLFPPAQLPLPDAIRNYARYRNDPDAWMLGRFICPTSKLAELAAFDLELFHDAPPFRFSALGRGGESAASFSDNLHLDLNAIREFHARHPGRVAVEAFEVRLPPDVVRDECTADLVRLLDRSRAAFADAGLAEISLACEAPPAQPAADRRQLNAIAAGGISFHNTKLAIERRGSAADRITLKVRCGGTTPDAFPSVEELSQILATALDMRVPLKFTAGLHHPLRRFDTSLRTDMHGFINVFAAVALTVEHEWRASEIAGLLADSRPTDFHFSDAEMGWAGKSAAIDALRGVRRSSALSFGSCSFDEPRADLRELGWL